MKREEIIKSITEHRVLIEEIRNDVKDIKDNHLKHIYEKIERFQFWLIGLLVTLVMTLIGTILNLIK